MPVFNGARFVREAVASALRSQDAELIVVDDGSTDETPLIVRQLGLEATLQKNLGPAAARNRGIAQASGDLIAFLDADDFWSESHPLRAREELERTGADLVFGETQCFSDGEPFGPRFHTFQLGSAVCRRDLFQRAGGFNEAMRAGEDVEWFLRARESGASIVAIPELSLYYRLHEGNRGRIHQSSRAGLLDALHESLQRRRNR
jgi:glycosyltransferase involved in cell wall biosynthesis